MAAPSHHHHHGICHSTVFCCGCNCCCGSGSLPPPSHPPQTDLLLQALATRLIHIQPPETPTPVSDHLKPEHFLKFQNLQKTRFQQQCQSKNHFSVAALLQRIDALEASIHHFHSSSQFLHSHPSSSLRDVAARTIQTHFRKFLVHRSRTLRHLKHLALIRSSVVALKSCAEPDLEELSYKAMDLLLMLDSIKGCDQTIREGKMSIHNELARYLDSLNHSLVVNRRFAAKNNNKSKGFVGKLLRRTSSDCPQYSRVYENNDEYNEIEGSSCEENSAFIGDGSHGFAKLKNEVLWRRSGLHPKQKKNVTSFADNRNLSRVSKDVSEPIPDIVSLENRLEILENLCVTETDSIAKPRNGILLRDSRLQPKISRVSENRNLSRVSKDVSEPIPDIVSLENRLEFLENFCITGTDSIAKPRNGILLRDSWLQPNIKKTARFANNEKLGNHSRVPKDLDLPISEVNQVEFVENIGREVEDAAERFSRGMEKENNDNGKAEIEDSLPNDDRLIKKIGQEGLQYSRVCENDEEDDEIEEICYEENPNVFIGNENPYSNIFSAPLPLKMESKNELLSKKV